MERAFRNAVFLERGFWKQAAIRNAAAAAVAAVAAAAGDDW